MDFRPAYHYRPKAHWINDPNGLIQHEGVVHLFYQYNPHGDQWGDIHWGHATSRDMVNWQTHPVAMAPAAQLGEVHCFSGGACQGHDGSPVFYYTSIGKEEEGRGGKDGAQQWIAMPTADLERLSQTDAHAMRPDMHGGMKVQEWRDPYVIRHGDRYLMVLGCRLEDSRGACLLYTSGNGLDFTYHAVLAQDESGTDYTWECPNFFPLEGRYVLFYSPCKAARYIIGDLTEDLRFLPVASGVLDEGAWEGFYAPQAFVDERGRSIVIGWSPDAARGDWQGITGWSGCFNLPREMYIEDNVLKMRVVPELQQLECGAEKGKLPLLKADAGCQYVLRLDVELADDGIVQADVFRSADGRMFTRLQVTADGRMRLIREHSTAYEGIHTFALKRRFTPVDGKAHIEIYADHSIVEAGCNGEWIAARVYPSGEDCTGVMVDMTHAEGVYELAQMKSCGK